MTSKTIKIFGSPGTGKTDYTIKNIRRKNSRRI
jgi:Ni2+-binding GTPase involved in maturation of urease and hydrogenase